MDQPPSLLKWWGDDWRGKKKSRLAFWCLLSENEQSGTSTSLVMMQSVERRDGEAVGWRYRGPGEGGADKKGDAWPQILMAHLS